MTFEEYKKKKQAEIDAFNKYKAAKYASTKPEEKPAEIKQTVKVASSQPALPTVKVAEPTPQKVSVQPRTELQKTAQRIATSAKPKKSDILALGAGPISEQMARDVSVRIAETPILQKRKLGIGETITRTLRSDALGYVKAVPTIAKMISEQEYKPITSAVKNLEKPQKLGIFPTIPEPVKKQLYKGTEFLDRKLQEQVKKVVKDQYNIDIDSTVEKARSSILNKLEKPIKDIEKKQQMLLTPIQDDKEGLSSVNEVASLVTSGGSSLLVAVGITALTKNPNIAAVVLSASESSDTYNEAREAGKSPEEAMKLAMTSGAVTALLEKVGLDGVLGKHGGRFLTSLASKNALNSIAVGAGQEVATETLQTWWQNLVKKLGYNEAQNVFEGTFETVIATIPVSVLVAGVNQASVRNIKDIEKEKIKRSSGVDNATADAVIDSILRMRKPMRESLMENPEVVIKRDVNEYKKSVESKINTEVAEPTPQAPVTAPVKPQTAITEVLAPKTTKVSPEPIKAEIKAEEPLITEARKYKSAEEFVKAQGTPVYHGTASDFEMFDPKFKGYSTNAESAKGAFWFTNDPATAKAYAIYAAEDAPVQRLLKQADEAEKLAQKTGKESDWAKYDKLVEESEKLAEYDSTFARREKMANVKEAYVKGEFLEVDAKGKTPQELSTDADIDSWLNSKIQQAIKDNKAGLKITNIDDAVGLYDRPSTHYAVFNADNIKTKSQLTDIWERANKATPETSLLQEAKKYKSAEEFVKAQEFGTQMSDAEKKFFNELGIKADRSFSEAEKDVFTDLVKGKIFHGTNSGDNIIKEGFSAGGSWNSGVHFTDSFGTANMYRNMGRGKGTGTNILSIDSKNLKLKDIDTSTMQDIKQGTGGLSGLVKEAKEQGFDGFKDNGGEYLVWNTKKINENITPIKDLFNEVLSKIPTKSQLTDIWNKAQEKPALPKKESQVTEGDINEVKNLLNKKEALEEFKKQYISEYEKTEEYYQIVTQAQLDKERAKEIDFESIIVSGIKNNPFYKKEGSIHDQMGRGYLMTKTILKKSGKAQKLQIVATPEQSKSLMKKGWDRGMEIDTWAQEAGFENGNEYLEYQLALSEEQGNLNTTEKSTHKILMERDENYVALVEEIKNTINELKQYEKKGITKKVVRTLEKAERDAQKRKPKEITSTETTRKTALDQPVKYGTGKVKESRTFKRLTQDLVDSGVEESRAMELAENRARAIDFVENNPEIAERVAFGLETVPEGMTLATLTDEVFKKLKDEGRTQEAIKLAKKQANRAIRSGQEIVSLKEIYNQNSTQRYVNELLRERARKKLNIKYEKGKPKANEVIRTRAEATNKQINKRASKIASAQKIIESIIC
jgi:hypothetical protein